MNASEAERRLRDDFGFYAAKCLKIVDQRAETVPLTLKRTQRKVIEALESQDQAGRPMRIVVLKARKTGVSTCIEGKITQLYTQRPNQKAVVVAHDAKTAGELFEMSEIMYSHLPDKTVGELRLKWPVVSSRKRAEIKLGEESRAERHKGNMGLNSSLLVDTAGEVQGGRGFTYRLVHLSEAAFYPDGKMTALINSVPDEPGTLIALETTANGHNHFRRFWKRAVAGNDFIPLFFPWFDEPGYERPFLSDAEREGFVVGEHEWGDAEPGLVEEFGLSLEQLNWRRWAIENRCEADLRIFQQEYPQNDDEAFLATSRQVFSGVLISNVLMRAERITPDQGLLEVAASERRTVGSHEFEIPTAASWKPREALDIAPVSQVWWRRYAEPDYGNFEGYPGFDRTQPARPPGQYIVSGDPASGEENEEGDLAYMAIEVIDHRTLEQVAEWRARSIDPDEMMLQALLAALYYNEAWISVEKTGGYGLSIINALVKTYRYSKLYRRRVPDQRTGKLERKVGWDTNERTKRLIVDYAKQLFRERTDGIRSELLASEAMTFIRDDQGRMGPDADAHSDCLMAWMIAQQVGREIPVKTFTPARRQPVRQVKSAVGGY